MRSFDAVTMEIFSCPTFESLKISAVSDTFESFVLKHPPSGRTLPFVHTTLYKFLPPLCSSGALEPRMCTVFKEPLLYFFYGRPAYRSKEGASPSTDEKLMPICLILKHDALDSKILRIHPFDTGAAHNDLFLPWIASEDKWLYMIPPSSNGLRAAVRAFFGTNKKYFEARSLNHGLAAKDKTTDPTTNYFSLISAEGDSEYDDRRSAFEVQSNTPIDIRQEVLAVVIPRLFMDNEEVFETIISDWKAYPITYSFVRGSRPSEYTRIIAAEVDSFLNKSGYY